MFPSLPLLEILSAPFKRAQQGLFQGKTKQYGNNVPFSKHKTRRTWLPNVHSKRFLSGALGEYVRVKVTTRALRTINKYGGIDPYVLKTKAELLGHEGMRLRVLVRERLEAQGRDVRAVLAAIPGRPVLKKAKGGEGEGGEADVVDAVVDEAVVDEAVVDEAATVEAAGAAQVQVQAAPSS